MIVVTAPTSSIGRQVLTTLAATDEALRVVVRDPSRLSAAVRDRVQVVTGSHGDPAVVDEAFDGADAVFWLLPPDPRAVSVEEAYVGFTRPAAKVLERRGTARVVGISALGRGTAVAGRAGFVTGSLAMDDLIAGTGVAYRAVVCPSFMDNTARQAALIRDQGVLTSPISGDRRLPSASTGDIAAVAAKLLLDRSWGGVEEVPVLGPEDLSFTDMAQVASEVLGRPVRFEQVAPQALEVRMRNAGMSHAMARGQVDMALAKDAGLDQGVARTPGNTTPTTFRQWCQDALVPAVAA